MQVWNKRDPNCPKDAVYVGRPSKWGNPFVVGQHGSRETCMALYQGFLANRVSEGSLVPKELKGKDLVCWCAPLSCHADVLFKLANNLS